MRSPLPIDFYINENNKNRDVAKSRIQGYWPADQPRKYNTCIQTLTLVYKEEGFKALFKGLVPKLVRFGPGKRRLDSNSSISCVSFSFSKGGAIVIIVYEEVYKFFKENYKG